MKHLVIWTLFFTLLLILIAIAVIVIVVPFRWRGDEYIPRYSLLDTLKDHHMKHKDKINTDTCYKNLQDFKAIMDQHQIPFALSEGTALGAIREGRILPWDDDVDVALLKEDQARYMKAVHPELLSIGFKYSHGKMNMLAYSRNQEKLDVSFIGQGYCEPGRMSDGTKLIPFLLPYRQVTLEDGNTYAVPGSNEYLVMLYGPHWTTPSTKSSNYGDRSKEAK